jgi:putative membrane protein
MIVMSNDNPINSDTLSLDRTRMAADRTLMSWIRTSLSLISFGFTIYKFLQAIREQSETGLLTPHSPRTVGLVLIGIGTISLVMACIQYYAFIRHLGLKLRNNPWDMTLPLATIIGLLGFLMFISIVFNMGPLR